MSLIQLAPEAGLWMESAALGNMVSDVVGLGTAGYVENLARKMGVQPPKMSPAQLDLTSTKLTSNLGRLVGVLIGCTIGMLPLLLVKRDDDETSESSGSSESSVSTDASSPTDSRKEAEKKS